MKPLVGDDLDIRQGLFIVSIRISIDLGISPLLLLHEGVECDDKDSIFAGGYSDVYRGTYRGQPVALKRPRFFSDAMQSEKDKVKRVR